MGVRAGLFDRFGDRIEDRNTALGRLSALARSDPGNHLRTVVQHLPGMEGSFAPGDPGHDNLRAFVN